MNTVCERDTREDSVCIVLCPRVKKGAKALNGKFPQIGETIGKYTKNIGEWLNNSGLEKLNQNIQAKSAKFVEKHPKLANSIKQNASLATVVGYLLASMGLSSKLQNDAHKNAEEYMTVLSMADKQIMPY